MWSNCPPPPLINSATEGEPIPVATAQLLALQMQFDKGLSAQSLNPNTLGEANAEVADLDGHPFYHLTLLGPGVKDFWQTVRNPQPNKSYQIYGTGAQNKRDFYSFILNESWFPDLNKTLAVAGSFKRFVSPSNGQLYLEDQSGRTWDVSSATQVDANTLQSQRTAFQTMLNKRSQEGVLDGLATAWKKQDVAVNSQSLGSQSLGGVSGTSVPTLKSLTLADGNVDVMAYIAALRVNEGRITTLASRAPYLGEVSSCEGFLCAGMRYSGAVRKHPELAYNENNPESNTYTYTDPYGTSQTRSLYNDFNDGDFGNRQSLIGDWKIDATKSGVAGVWANWDAVTPTLVQTDVLGCGPTAVMRLFNWYARHRNLYTKSPIVNLANSSNVIVNQSDYVKSMALPIQIGTLNNKPAYKPEMGVYTDTRWFVNGVAIRDTSIMSGVNRWIADKARILNNDNQIRMYGNSFAFVNLAGFTVYTNPIGAISFSQYTWQIRDLVRDKIGRDNEPIVIMYGFNSQTDVTGHNILSQAYIVHEGWFSANVLAWVTSNRGDGQGGSFVNITDATGTYGGAWGLNDVPVPLLTPPPPAPPRPPRVNPDL